MRLAGFLENPASLITPEYTLSSQYETVIQTHPDSIFPAIVVDMAHRLPNARPGGSADKRQFSRADGSCDSALHLSGSRLGSPDSSEEYVQQSSHDRGDQSVQRPWNLSRLELRHRHPKFAIRRDHGAGLRLHQLC